MSRRRPGIIVTHPLRYQVPLYRYLTARSTVEPVIFLTEHGLAESFDPGFGRAVKYMAPPLVAYEYQVLPSCNLRPSPRGPSGVLNPSLPKLIRRSHVDALLVRRCSSISHLLVYATAVCSHMPHLLQSESRPDRINRHSTKLIVKRAMLRPLVRRARACLAIGADNRQYYRSCGAHLKAPGGCGDDNGQARGSREPHGNRGWALRPDIEQLGSRRPRMNTRIREPSQKSRNGTGLSIHLFFHLPTSSGVAVNEAMAAGLYWWFPMLSAALPIWAHRMWAEYIQQTTSIRSSLLSQHSR